MAGMGQQGHAFPSSLPCSLPLMFLTEVPQGNKGSLMATQPTLSPHHRTTLGEETSLNLTRIHLGLKQTLVTTSVHDGVFCATRFTDHWHFWF